MISKEIKVYTEMDLRFIDIPKIENDMIFEDLAKDILTADIPYENINVHGRPGQKQDGIDVYARETKSTKWIGVQCKVRSTNKAFTKQELLAEINQAKSFNPKISSYYLYTTLSRDTTTQALEREINVDLLNEGSFKFEILFWEDIENKLKQPQFEMVYYRYYHKYFKDNQTLGHAIGKLINLDLQFDSKSDSHYELLIGKIPFFQKEKQDQSDYYRGTYFIANLLDNTIDIFNKSQTSNSPSVFPSDIEDAITNKIDCYRISKWLCSIEHIDNFIYNNIHDYKFSISSKERYDYMNDSE